MVIGKKLEFPNNPFNKLLLDQHETSFQSMICSVGIAASQASVLACLNVRTPPANEHKSFSIQKLLSDMVLLLMGKQLQKQ